METVLTNNSLNNFEVTTSSENLIHAYVHGLNSNIATQKILDLFESELSLIKKKRDELKKQNDALIKGYIQIDEINRLNKLIRIINNHIKDQDELIFEQQSEIASLKDKIEKLRNKT